MNIKYLTKEALAEVFKTLENTNPERLSAISTTVEIDEKKVFVLKVAVLMDETFCIKGIETGRMQCKEPNESIGISKVDE